MTSPRWAVAAGVMILVAAGCENAQPTEPALGAPTAAAPTENHGNGAQFQPVPDGVDILTGFADGNGNNCLIGYSPQEGAKSRSDFFRTNPDGSLTIHSADSAAPLTITFGGRLYTGVGQATASATVAPDFETYEQWVVNATGKVVGPDGQTYNARCMGRVEDDGFTIGGTIEVH